MKKLFIIFTLIVISLGVNAQRVYTITADTIDEAATVNFDIPAITGYYESLAIQVLCTEIGGTSDGTVVIQGSLDGTSFVTLTDENDVLKGFTNDTLTVTDGAVGLWVLKNPTFVNYRIAATGTANDTTLITPKYILKR